MKSFWETALELQMNHQSFVTVTVLGSRGSAPQDPGAKAIVTENGLHWGTVGGGKVEARAISKSQEILKSQNPAVPEVITWNLQRDIGMSCGGEITYLFESHYFKSWPIVIFGAGHVSQALVRVLQNLNCQLTIVDTRLEWLEKLPQANNIKQVLVTDMAEYCSSLHSTNYFVTMTQGHAYDLPILKQLFTLFPSAHFIGTIGSKIKGLRLRKELLEFGISKKQLDDFRCPIGIPMGGNHPFEIAISVSAQLLQARDQQFFSKPETDSKKIQPTSAEKL